jgi:hypothetical protein
MKIKALFLKRGRTADRLYGRWGHPMHTIGPCHVQMLHTLRVLLAVRLLKTGGSLEAAGMASYALRMNQHRAYPDIYQLRIVLQGVDCKHHENSALQYFDPTGWELAAPTLWISAVVNR